MYTLLIEICVEGLGYTVLVDGLFWREVLCANRIAVSSSSEICGELYLDAKKY